MLAFIALHLFDSCGRVDHSRLPSVFLEGREGGREGGTAVQRKPWSETQRKKCNKRDRDQLRDQKIKRSKLKENRPANG